MLVTKTSQPEKHWILVLSFDPYREKFLDDSKLFLVLGEVPYPKKYKDLIPKRAELITEVQELRDRLSKTKRYEWQKAGAILEQIAALCGSSTGPMGGKINPRCCKKCDYYGHSSDRCPLPIRRSARRRIQRSASEFGDQQGGALEGGAGQALRRAGSSQGEGGAGRAGEVVRAERDPRCAGSYCGSHPPVMVHFWRVCL